MENKVIVVLGHGPTKEQDPGAVNKASGMSEFVWNEDFILNFLIPQMRKWDIPFSLVRRTKARVMPWREVNQAAKPGDICISFHANAFKDNIGDGFEVLYYHTSKNSKRLATLLRDNVNKVIGNRLRWGKDDNGESVENGLIPISKATERGYPLLRNTSTPCALLEPFFIGTDKELANINDKKREYATAVCKSILDYYKK